MTLKNKNTKIVLAMSLFVAILSAYSAVLGFVDKDLYGNVVETGVFKMSFMPGTISQDIITIISSVLMVVLILSYLKSKDAKILICITGLLGYYLYAYATYVISALFTSIYIIYMLIFMLSLFGLISGLCGFKNEQVVHLYLPKWIRISSTVFLSLIICIFTSKWVTSIIPYTQSHTVPDFYAIFILDLCIVMPFFAVTVYMLAKNLKYAYILLGIALVKTTTLILAVAIGSFIAPVYGIQEEADMTTVYCAVTLISFVLLAFYSIKLTYKERMNVKESRQ